MNDPRSSNQGFDPHVIDQLQQIASSPSSNSRGQHSRKRGKPQYQKFDFDNQQHVHQYQQSNRSQRVEPTPASRPNHVPIQSSDAGSFPTTNVTTREAQQFQQSQSQQSLQPHPGQQIHGHQQHHWQSHATNTNAYRGRNNFRYGPRSRGSSFNHAQGESRQFSASTDDFSRPQPNQGHLYQPGGNPFFGTAEQQRAFRHKIMSQSDFLSSIAGQALHNQISPEEFREKEAFRKVIEEIAQKVIVTNSSKAQNFDIGKVKLKLYGSLGSGFGVAGSDMDLLLTFPLNEDTLDGIDIESRRWLEKGLLDAGYGARLLTNTRVPILKVCQEPSMELLTSLREYRQQWDDSVSKDMVSDVSAVGEIPLPPFVLASFDIVESLQKISLEAIDIPLPDVQQAEQAKLEFIGDCGIQCDVNFTNYVALHNTDLLRVYGQCDPRVRQVGLFVKHWAKARDINTPYKGTLSSYGYIMLVLHYMINIVNPPLLPNLQVIAKDQDNWERKTDIETVEGFDVRFVRDPEQVQHIMANMKPNHESIGSLLRGFFWYYACNGGFHWTRDVISIRTRGGQLSKYSKGWTGAKWSESKQNVRLRYLLAIEDPFEIEHNIGRTVGHSGIVAIRDEFRRAWSIIENVQLDPMQRVWVWSNNGEVKLAEELMEPLHDRGDLLRKDLVAYKDRLRQMRKEAEAKEQALRDGRSEDGSTDHHTVSGAGT